MPDGKHCPACGNDVGYWAVALGLFRIRCPHCGAKLHHRLDGRMNAITNCVAVTAGFGSMLPGFLVARAVFEVGSGSVATVAGIAVWVGLAFGVGLLFQMAAAPVLRRTQLLMAEGQAEQEKANEEEPW